MQGEFVSDIILSQNILNFPIKIYYNLFKILITILCIGCKTDFYYSAKTPPVNSGGVYHNTTYPFDIASYSYLVLSAL